MKFQLVIQWPSFLIEDFDDLIMIEDRLIEKLSEGNEVDGHDIGAEEINIFIRTDNPKKTFNEIKSVLGDGVYWTDVRVAYREVAESEYIILWPQSLTKFAVK